MIVISGALVLVALVLLVLGLTMTDLAFVYGSIAVSLVSFVFLVIGILQRRGERTEPDAPEVSAAPDAQDSPSAKPAETDPDPARAGSRPPMAAVSAPDVDDVDDDDLEPGGGPVLIVAGRPRYHVEGCRYLNGREAEELDVLDAREDGFSPCGVCKPDDALAELYGPLEPADEPEAEPEPADEPEPDREVEPVVDTGVPGAGEEQPAPAARRGSRAAAVPASRTGRAPARTPAPAQAVPAKAPARAPAKDPVKPRAAGTRSKPAETPATAVLAVPFAVPDPGAPSSAAPPAAAEATGRPAAKAPARSKVVVIPDRGRFHLSRCRFVRDALGTEELTRAQAGKQGYQACGVCKP